MSIVPIEGLFETHLTVRDLERAITFYRDVLGLQLAHRVPARGGAFFWLGRPGGQILGQQMLGLWSIGTSPLSLHLHIAFQVALDQVSAAIPALRAAGLTPSDGFGGNDIDEPIVFAWMPAASVYFRDPDGHSLEFISMLPHAARPELGRLKLSAWMALQQAQPAKP